MINVETPTVQPAEERTQYRSLREKRVIVTGGGSGIGAAIVEGFVNQGSRVAFVDRTEEASRALVDRIAANGRHAPSFYALDLKNLDELSSTFSIMAEQLGGVDVLVNNAASDDRHTIEEVDARYWDDRMNVNLRHVFFASQAVIPAMRSAGGGAIVNLGSISWHLGLERLTLYQTAKAAIEGLTRSLARELGRDGIRVNAIVPGNVQTPKQERWYTPDGEAEIVAAQCLKSRIQPSDVAAMAMFLASSDAKMCTGHNYWVDAGWR